MIGDMKGDRRRRWRLSQFVVALIAGGFALIAVACADKAPTRPIMPTAASAESMTPVVVRPAGNALLEDATGRLLPSLANVTARARLRGYLADLGAALEAGNVAAARRQIGLARKVLAAQARSGDAADLSAIGLALDQLELELDGSAPPQP